MTSLELYGQGAKMLQSSTSSDIPLVNASYQFVPGFAISTNTIVLSAGETATVSVYPDTIPTNDVIVDVISSDPSVLSITSPLQMLAGVDSHRNVRTISLTHKRAGTATLSLSPRSGSGNYQDSFFGAVVSVSCRAQIVATPAALTLRKGTLRDIILAGNPPPEGVWRVSFDRDLHCWLCSHVHAHTHTYTVCAFNEWLLCCAIGNPKSCTCKRHRHHQSIKPNTQHWRLRIHTHTTTHTHTNKATLSIRIQNPAVFTYSLSLSLIHTHTHTHTHTGNITLSIRVQNTAVFTVSPSQFILTSSSPSPAIRVTFAGVGETVLDISVVSTEPGRDVLYAGTRVTIPLFGVPGLSVTPVTVSLQPLGTATITLAPDSAPTLKTFVTITNSDPSLLDAPLSVMLPARATTSRTLVITHKAPGSATLSLSASSPGIIAQLSQGCESANARACSAAFVARGCSFDGYQGSGVDGTSVWRGEMRNISLSTGVSDCTVHERCLRVSCCAAPRALQCAQAAVSRGCTVDTMVPPLSDIENTTSDWGLMPLSTSSQLAHYQTWVPGVSCLPFVPCAWDRCFPGGGNLDGAVSDDVRITALPGMLYMHACISCLVCHKCAI
jgi:hypothetical protein